MSIHTYVGSRLEPSETPHPTKRNQALAKQS